jgi:putative sterol carrier protein
MTEDDDGPLMDAQEYAALVHEATDEQLTLGLEVNRQQILDGIFAAMPERVNHEHAPSGQFVAEWRITGGPDGGEDRWQVILDGGECKIERDGTLASDVTFTVGPLDFVKLVTGNAKGPRLFFFGRLKIDGDLLKAARYNNYFETPRPQRQAQGGDRGLADA